MKRPQTKFQAHAMRES